MPLQAYYLGMAMFSKNNNVLFLIVRGFNAVLQFQHYGAGGINQRNVVLQGGAVSIRCFAVCTDEHFFVMQVHQVGMVYNAQTFGF